MEVLILSSPAAVLAGSTASHINDEKSVAPRAPARPRGCSEHGGDSPFPMPLSNSQSSVHGGHRADKPGVSPDALSIAETLNKELSDSGVRGPVLGISFIIKDNIRSDDKHNTSRAASFFWAADTPVGPSSSKRSGPGGGPPAGPRFASVGAGPLAATNFSYGYSTQASQIRNPFNPTPMKDVALLLDAMAGPEQYDNLTWNGPGRYPQDGYSVRITSGCSLNAGLDAGQAQPVERVHGAAAVACG
ncbi:hypothetical protein DL769_011456 [Monosporascus sp. CRB-8-3]|nr:hypothetical protein DL769_011456 [Monosporascus sp. CRB-8-3]